MDGGASRNRREDVMCDRRRNQRAIVISELFSPPMDSARSDGRSKGSETESDARLGGKGGS